MVRTAMSLADDLTPAHVRASDAERERVVTLLRDHAGEGRLDTGELDERLERAYGARTRGELAELLGDLPEPPVPEGARARHRRRRRLSPQLVPYVAVNLLLVGIWAATGAGYFWPIWPILGWGIGLLPHGACSRRRRRVAA
jgi:hypothetical protein